MKKNHKLTLQLNENYFGDNIINDVKLIGMLLYLISKYDCFFYYI